MTKPQLAVKLAEAAAIAEGYTNPHNRPWRDRNPGDLDAGAQGSPTDGLLIVYPTQSFGWAAAENLWAKIINGLIPAYRNATTIAQIAAVYTGQDNAQAWAAVVATYLGTTPNNTLESLLT